MKIYPNEDAPLRYITLEPAPAALLPFTAIAAERDRREVMFVNLALMGRGQTFPAWFGFPDLALVPVDGGGRPIAAPQALAFAGGDQPLVVVGVAAEASAVVSYGPHPLGGDAVRQVRIERGQDGGTRLDGSNWALSVRFPAGRSPAPAEGAGPARTLPATLWLSFVVAATDETPAILAADPVWLGRELDSTDAFRPFDKVIATAAGDAYAQGPLPILHNRGFSTLSLRAEQLRDGVVTVDTEEATLRPGSSAAVRIGFDASQPGRFQASVSIEAADEKVGTQADLEIGGIVDPPPLFAEQGPQLSAFEAHRGDTIRAIGDHMDGIAAVALMDFANAKFHFLRALDSTRTAVAFRIAEDVPLGTWRVGLVTQSHGAFHARSQDEAVDSTPQSFLVAAEPPPFDLPPDAPLRPDGMLACDVVAISDQLLTMGAWSARAPAGELGAGIALVAARDGRLHALRPAVDMFARDRDWPAAHPGEDPYVPGGVVSYDPETDAWSAPSPLPLRLNMAAAFGPSGEIFLTGEDRRENYVGSWTAYDPRTGAVRACAPMPSRRTRASLAVANGQIYAIGGYSGSSIGSGRVSTVEEYDPGSDTWTTKAAMPRSPAAFGVATALNGMIYVAGGQEDAKRFGPNGMRPNPPNSAMLEYDPGTDVWTTKAPMREGRAAVGMGAGLNGRVYVVGGGATGLVVEEYDPATDRWLETAPLPQPRWGPSVATSADGTIYVAGGWTSTGPLSDMIAMRP